MNTKKKSHPMWDDDLGKSVTARFSKEKTMDGRKQKGVKVFAFEIRSSREIMVKPPLGFPSELPGSQIKKIPGNPDLALDDESMFPIDYY